MAAAPTAPVKTSCDTAGTPGPGRMPSRTLRVLHVLPSFHSGGMERLVTRLICAEPTAVQNEETTASLAHGLCVLHDGDKQLLDACRPHAPILMLERPGRDYLAWLHLRQVVNAFQPDVVEALSTGVWLDAVLATRGLRRPRLVLSFHGRADLDPLSSIRLRLNTWCVRRADAVVTVSRESAQRIVHEWNAPPLRMHTIPNGLDLAHYRPAVDRDEQQHLRHKLGLPTQSPIALCVANLVPIKALDVLLNAWRQVRMMHRSAQLILAGDGPLRDELQRQAIALGCDSSVRFLGTRHDVELLMRAADTFVLSSRYEGCSIAIQEAMACGLPVVATHAGGTNELVAFGQTGWLVPPDRPDQLAERLQLMLTDEWMRQRMGHAARELAVRRFGLDRCAREYASLYANLTHPGCPTADRLPATEVLPCAG